MSRNDTNFPAKVSARVGEYMRDYEADAADATDAATAPPDKFLASFLRYYQYILMRYMNDDEFGKMGVRGLLVDHHMGLGKTRGAAVTAMTMVLSRRPILIVGKSVQPEFLKELAFVFSKLADIVGDEEHASAPENAGLSQGMRDLVAKFPTPKEFLAQFRIVTADAYNSADQLMRASQSQSLAEELSPSKVSQRHAKGAEPPVKRASSAVDSVGSLEDTLVIVDEAHNFFRAIVNSSNDESNARRLYRMIMETRNIKLMFLTGTPVMKDPFELVPCFNMLAGYDILPVDYGQFRSIFVGPDGGVKNKAVLLNRIFGLVSYMPMPDIPVRGNGGLPELHPYEIVNIEMSKYQYKHYMFAREKEHQEESRMRKWGDQSSPLSLPGKGDKASSYFVKSRMTSIYVPPQGEVGDAFRRQQAISELSAEAFGPENSTKLTEAIRIIEKSPGIVMAYSQFVNYGLNALVGYMRRRGFLAWDEQPREAADAAGGAVSAGQRYAIISGDVAPKIRKDIQEALNDPNNVRGEKIRVILVSKTGIEGLNLWYIRRIIVLEPYWDMSRIEQLSARGVRLGSHDALPVEERDVRVYILVSTPNQEVLNGLPPGEEKETTSMDMRFLENAQSRHKAVAEIRRIVRTVAIECDKLEASGQTDYACRLCAPTSERLFSKDIRDDVQKKDPCVPMTRSDVKAKKLDTKGEYPGDIFYRKNAESPIGYDFFEHSSKFSSYVNIPYDDSRIWKLLTLANRKKGGSGGEEPAQTVAQ